MVVHTYTYEHVQCQLASTKYSYATNTKMMWDGDGNW